MGLEWQCTITVAYGFEPEQVKLPGCHADKGGLVFGIAAGGGEKWGWD